MAGKLIRKAVRAAPSSRASPKSRRRAPMAYAPPAMPPRKKYQMMYHSHCGGATKCWGTSLLLSPAIAERDHSADDPEHGRHQRAQVTLDVVAARQHGVLRVGQPVGLGRIGQEEQGVEPAVLLVTVESRLGHALAPELIQPRRGDVAHLAQVSELDRFRRTGLGARRRQVVLKAAVAERALLGEAGLLVEADDVVWAGRDAVATAVADVGPDVDGVELRANDRVGRADFHAARERAVLADVAHHAPGDATLGPGLLEEPHVPPVLVVELARVVEPVEKLGGVPGQLVPFLARHLAGLAPDAERRVGEEADGSGHVRLLSDLHQVRN